MSDEEIVRAFLGDGVYQDDEGLDYVNRSGHEALSRILSDRDALRERCFRTEESAAEWARMAGRLTGALERIASADIGAFGESVFDAEGNDIGSAGAMFQTIARQALTSSEKESE